MLKKTSKRLTLPSLLLSGLATLMLAVPVASADEDASADAQAALAPAGDCAKPRGLADGAQPTAFDVAGNPASRLVPAQVPAGLAPAGPRAPSPTTPNPPSASLCDAPQGCSPARPIFIESEPVPGLPPGASP
jgi:hypothetical protein